MQATAQAGEGAQQRRGRARRLVLAPKGWRQSHVVPGMEDITVEFLGQEPIRARTLGFQPRADLALLQIESVPADAPVAPLGGSDRVEVGDSVFIIGAPYGLTYSLSTDIISAR